MMGQHNSREELQFEERELTASLFRDWRLIPICINMLVWFFIYDLDPMASRHAALKGI